MVTQDLFAFWSYDLFPYVLGSPVIEILEGGLVRVEGFGRGTFRPKVLLPRLEGERLYAQIQALAGKRQRELDDVKARYLKELDKVKKW